MSLLLEGRALRREYLMGTEVVRAVRDVSLGIEAGEHVSLVGPSGCGKSTLLHLLGGVDRPTAGHVLFRGSDLYALGDRERTAFRLRNLGFVFQRFHLVPVLTAGENVELPMAEAGVAPRERRRRAAELLEFVGLAGRVRHRPAQLSGGEQQRVAIARAMANRPALVLADEPTGELDGDTGREVIALFGRLREVGTALLIVTHDAELAAAAGRVIRMRDGALVGAEEAHAGA